METFKERILLKLTFRSLASFHPPNNSHQMWPGDEKCLLGKRRGNEISLSVRAYEFPPYVTYVTFLFSIMMPGILSYLDSWRCRRPGRWCQGCRELLRRIWGVTPIIIKKGKKNIYEERLVGRAYDPSSSPFAVSDIGQLFLHRIQSLKD